MRVRNIGRDVGNNNQNSQEIDAEEDKKLDQLLGLVSNMRGSCCLYAFKIFYSGVAEATKDELHTQNKLLHRLENKIDFTTNRIQKTTNTAKRLID